MTLGRAVTVIDPNDVGRFISETAGRGAAIYRFSTKGATGRSAFFGTIRHTLPLDPPLVGSRSWDALSDSLWSGLHETSDNSIAIFWGDSSDFKDASSSDYSIALEILNDITGSLTDQSITNGRPKQISIYISLLMERF
jgi:hypothetical protein